MVSFYFFYFYFFYLFRPKLQLIQISEDPTMLCYTDFDVSEKSIPPHALLAIQKHTVSPSHLLTEVKQEICILLNTTDINKIWNDESQKLQGD